MKLKIYRIDRSWLGKVGRRYKTPDLPPAPGALTLGSGLIGRIWRTYKDVMEENVYILAQDEEIDRFRDPRGLTLQEGIYYVRNPAELHTRDLIPVNEFHPYIVRQQTAEMIDYLRENLSVTCIKIEINRDNSASVNANMLVPPTEMTPPLDLSGSVKVKKMTNHSVELLFDKPLRPSEKRKQYGWIDSFPQLVAAVDNVASNGRITLEESYDLSFGLDSKLGGFFGFSLDWLDNHNWKLEVHSG